MRPNQARLPLVVFLARNPKRIMLLGLLVAVLVTAGDRLRVPGRVRVGLGAERYSSLVPRERFHLFGWVGPPLGATNATRMSEMAEAGLNLALPALDDAGRPADNLARLDLAAAYGIRCILRDWRFEGIDADRRAGPARLDSIVADYRRHVGFFGYYLGDEPPRSSFGVLERFHRALRDRDREHPAWNNLTGRAFFPNRRAWLAHHRDYLDRTGASVLCNDQYDFLLRGDRGQFVENAAGLASLARERGVPFWGIVQLTPHGPFRAIGPGELSWQVGMLLAYGARGIGYFTYWTPPPDPQSNWQPGVIDADGRRTEWFGVLETLNPAARAIGETLAGLTWLATEHAGSVPLGGTRYVPDDWVGAIEGRVAVGHFADALGTPHLLVANSDSLTTQTVGLKVGPARRACVLGEGVWSWDAAFCTSLSATAAMPLQVVLGPGGFALVRLEGGVVGRIAAGTAPGLVAQVDDAGGAVRIVASRLGRDGGLEITDAVGRRVWSARLGRGERATVWHGEQRRKGVAAPGLYYVRLEDDRGLAVTPIEWRAAEAGVRMPAGP